MYSGRAEASQQNHAALQTGKVMPTRVHVTSPQCLESFLHGIPRCQAYRHFHSTGQMGALTAARLGAKAVQPNHQRHNSSSKDVFSIYQDTESWVGRVLAPEFQDEASRRTVTHMFRNINQLLHCISLSTHPDLHRHSMAQMQRSRQLLVSMNFRLPEAVCELADRAAYLATVEDIGPGERLHAPVALLLYSTTLHAAPPALTKYVMQHQHARGAFESILQKCILQRSFSHIPRDVSMVCKALILLHECGVEGGIQLHRCVRHGMAKIQSGMAITIDKDAQVLQYAMTVYSACNSLIYTTTSRIPLIRPIHWPGAFLRRYRRQVDSTADATGACDER